MLVASLMLGAATPAFASSITGGDVIGGGTTVVTPTTPPAATTPGDDGNLGEDTIGTVTTGNDRYVIKLLTKGKAAVTKVPATTNTWFSVKSKVTYKNKSYTITRIAENTFSKNKQLTSVTLPSTITTINKDAFAGLTKLKRINLNVSKDITVYSGAFGSINTAKVTIRIPKSTTNAQLKKLKAKFKAAGFKGTIKRAL
jgi:redox-regulated HSP33 family molecular chaperone